MVEARGVEPLFDGVRLRLSADVLLEGAREEAERRGLSRMAPDVITFVITSSLMASARLWKQLQGILRFIFKLKNMLLHIFRLEAKAPP